MNIVRDLGVSLPLLIVYVLGLGIALSQMSRLPRVAIAAGGAFALLLVMQIVRPIVYWVVSRMLNEFGLKPELPFAATGFLFNLIEAAAVAGLVYAIFADRPQAAPVMSNPAWPQKPPL